MDSIIYLGVKGSITAIDTDSGRELWRRHLKSSGFVTVHVGEDKIIAHTAGHLFAVDKRRGRILWENRLAGLGYGLASLATTSQDVLAQEIQDQEARRRSASRH